MNSSTRLASTNVPMLARCISSTQARSFSVAYNVKSKFEEAYKAKMETQNRLPPKVPEPQNKAEYGTNYYNKQRLANMKVGYVHPYHTEGSPIYMSNLYFFKNLFAAVGPEQVSPHYETLSRSRRGVLFIGLYVATIATVSRMGGWNYNDWMRGMLWHHEFLIAYYLGYIETRHFAYFFGPKFSVFYRVYSSYEFKQIANMWADKTEMAQHEHLRHTKEQLEYNRIDSEYEFVKKRSLVNFLANSKLNSEAHFHQRALSMLNQIKYYENANLKANMREIAVGSLEKVIAQVNDPANAAEVKRSSFESALDGIRSGSMTYKGDKILPMIEAEMKERLEKFKGLSAEEESKLLSLTPEQQKLVADNDRKLKNEFLHQAPQINHGAIKAHDKYKSYMSMVHSAAQ
eukprot:CAMPEP_0168612474 /NCGR_PEP_ID=MMETSP0449_2-20121227/2938_1 /TAXON_ID=1082188 /ORGANISM="Strombidium rassoulzadegani, Strain ras09" /LENGTH=401 /DNA_ID=CAMNT_0008653045 /DNA_START=8 /DNA_END=1213 /DNA_ORIENTATION=-